ncbi:MAG TPA: ADP-polyphosphate phosphotransferase [Opitutaceae bacterium]|nr:ADP-polyphosphate phosphotransferase [Opitutaceae bacterium]
MKNKPENFAVPANKKVKLERYKTDVASLYDSDDDYEEQLEDFKKGLRKLQELMYAQGRYALLIIFQAMDAGGKDGAIEHVMSGVNPQGCQVFSFKQPSSKDLAHDFLWRTTACLPERGHIGIFNRSYYEEVLIVRVHPEILQREPLPEQRLNDKDIWKGRFRSIVDFENHLHRNGTHIIKFFLHISKGAQKKRFLDRLDDPDKYWKFSAEDVEERKYWKEYMHAYEACLSATSTKHAPWFIIPADDKKNARLIISKIILSAIKRMDMHYPEMNSAQLKEFAAIRKRLK